jgi:hypothetical protein
VRATAPLLCLLLSGCAAAGSLTAEDAKSSLAAKDNVLSRLSQSELTPVVQAAQQWSAGHGGDMTGFAVELRSTQPSVTSALLDLTDVSATVSAGVGQCLTAQLPSGAQAKAAC